MDRRTFLMFAGATLLRDKKHKHICKRCGLCCLPPCARPKTWLNVSSKKPLLDDSMKKSLRVERKKYKRLIFPACEMVYWDSENKVAVCLVHKLFGKDKKPKECKSYPSGRMCLREHIFRRRNK